MWEQFGGGEIERYEEKVKRYGHFVYGMWNGDLTCNILPLQQEERISEGSDNTTLQEMIEQADKMMYENKKKLKKNAK